MSTRLLSRRRVLLRTALLTLLTVLVAAGPAPAPPARSYVSGNFYLSLGGTGCGFLKSVDGGAIYADVIQESAGASSLVKKHIGQPKYEAFRAQIGFSMTPAVYTWIAGSWGQSPGRQSGAIAAVDYQLQAKSERDFTEALITETTIPACDGSSKEPAYLEITFAPEYIHQAPAPSDKLSGEFGKNEQKVWLPSNFRLEIDGLSCAKVTKIDSFTVKRETISVEIGESRDYVKEASELVFPNLRVTMAEVDSQTWRDWFDDFVVRGHNDDSKEKNGTLTFLSPNRQTELARVIFHNLGICRLESEKFEANADQIKRVTAELYCERMEFEYLNKPVGEKPGAGATRAAMAGR